MTNPRQPILRGLLAFVSAAALTSVAGSALFPDHALVIAARLGWALPAEALLAWGADPGRCTSGGENALTMAALRGRYDVVEEIVQSGHSLDSKDARGKTALQLAIEMGHDDIANLLSSAKRNGRERGSPTGCEAEGSRAKGRRSVGEEREPDVPPGVSLAPLLRPPDASPQLRPIGALAIMVALGKDPVMPELM